MSKSRRSKALERSKINYRIRRAKESDEQKQLRLARDPEIYHKLSPQKPEARLKKMRNCNKRDAIQENENRMAELIEEQKKRKKKSRLKNRAVLTVEERERREKKNASQRNYQRRKKLAAEMEKEQLIKEIVLYRNCSLELAHKEYEEQQQRQREENRNKLLQSCETQLKVHELYEAEVARKKRQKEYQRKRRDMLTVEEREKTLAQQRAYNNIRRFSAKIKMDQPEINNQLSLELACKEVENKTDSTSGSMKPFDVKDEPCETSTIANVEEGTAQIEELDYFEECEDWKIHIKTENDYEE